MLRDDIERYTELTGEDGSKVPIMKIGSFLDGYEKGAKSCKRVGYWKTNRFGTIFCSECGGIRKDNRAAFIAYCNKCGAKMEKREVLE